jgi:hypothetical protein
MRFVLLPLVFLLPLHVPGSAAAQPRRGELQREVVQNTSRPVDGAPMQVTRSPVLQIGGSPTDPLAQFHGVVDGVRLADGTVVVANGGAHEIRIFGPDGRHRATFGRSGDGPGEFRRLASLAVLAGDTLAAFDRAHQRVTLITPHGQLAGSIPVAGDGLRLAELRRVSRGRWVGRTSDRLAAGTVGRLGRDSVGFVALDASLRRRSDIATVPGLAVATFIGLGGDRAFRPAPFAKPPRYATFGGCLYVAPGDGFDILVFSPANVASREIRNPWPRRVTTRRDLEHWRDALLAEAPEPARGPLGRILAALPAGDSLPGYNQLVVDHLGYLLDAALRAAIRPGPRVDRLRPGRPRDRPDHAAEGHRCLRDRLGLHPGAVERRRR